MESNLKTVWGVLGVLFLTLAGAAVMLFLADSRSREMLAESGEKASWEESAQGVEPLKLKAPPGPERGKEIYTTVCFACHGLNAEGMRPLNAPSLHQQEDWYIVAQLKKFREGKRGNHPKDLTGAQMRAMVAGLPDPGAFGDLAAFVTTLNAPPPSPEGNGDPMRGKGIYRARCAPCHGETGTGSKTYQAPALVGQYDWYVAAQLNKFREGIRGAGTQDKTGALMQWISTNLSGVHIRDVSAYIATLVTGGVEGEPATPEPAAGLPPVSAETAAGSSAAAASGAEVFQSRCVTCHGSTGNGDGPAGRSLPVKPRSFGDPAWQASVTDQDLEAVIVRGGAALGKSVFMVPNPDLGGQPEILAELIKIVRGFKK